MGTTTNCSLRELKRTLPYKWRVQSFSRYKPEARCVAYIDARDVMDLLDEVVGPENWQDRYKEISGQLFCGVGIRCENKWVWKWDTGVESDIEKEKGLVSDAFKRAAVKWGIGRFLYALDTKTVRASSTKTSSSRPYVVDNFGRRVEDLTEYINALEKPAAATAAWDLDKQFRFNYTPPGGEEMEVEISIKALVDKFDQGQAYKNNILNKYQPFIDFLKEIGHEEGLALIRTAYAGRKEKIWAEK